MTHTPIHWVIRTPRRVRLKPCAVPIKSARASNHLRRSPFKPWFRGLVAPIRLISVSLYAGKT
jgi:hypothetical protein